jgi:hypothetical protein
MKLNSSEEYFDQAGLETLEHVSTRCTDHTDGTERPAFRKLIQRPAVLPPLANSP